jgi:hypothetical protein
MNDNDKSETKRSSPPAFTMDICGASDMGWGRRGREFTLVFTAILTIWFLLHPDQKAETFGGCPLT